MPTKFRENLPIGSKVARRQTHRQDGDLIILFPFLESRLNRHFFDKTKVPSFIKLISCNSFPTLALFPRFLGEVEKKTEQPVSRSYNIRQELLAM
jgi:hypothetical protein